MTGEPPKSKITLTTGRELWVTEDHADIQRRLDEDGYLALHQIIALEPSPITVWTGAIALVEELR